MNYDLARLTIDFTKLLSDKWALLEDDERKEFFKMNYVEKLATNVQPKNPNSTRSIIFYSLLSNNGVVVSCAASYVHF